jgi:hypothetical protein
MYHTALVLMTINASDVITPSTTLSDIGHSVPHSMRKTVKQTYTHTHTQRERERERGEGEWWRGTRGGERTYPLLIGPVAAKGRQAERHPHGTTKVNLRCCLAVQRATP